MPSFVLLNQNTTFLLKMYINVHSILIAELTNFAKVLNFKFFGSIRGYVMVGLTQAIAFEQFDLLTIILVCK